MPARCSFSVRRAGHSSLASNSFIAWPASRGGAVGKPEIIALRSPEETSDVSAGLTVRTAERLAGSNPQQINALSPSGDALIINGVRFSSNQPRELLDAVLPRFTQMQNSPNGAVGPPEILVLHRVIDLSPDELAAEAQPVMTFVEAFDQTAC